MIKGLPERLKNLRLKYCFSQKQVANKLGISPSIVSGYETGERTPSTEVLLAISHLYNCSTDYLLGRQSDNNLMLDLTGLSAAQINAIAMLIEAIRDN